MTQSYPSSSSTFLLPILAAVAVFFIGYGVIGFISGREQADIWKGQAAELQNPAVFVITSPESQPAGTEVAIWSDGDRNFRLRFGTDGTVSLSDPYDPTAVQGRRSASIIRCSTLSLSTYNTHPFTHKGKSYTVLLTRFGNAAVCRVK